MLTRYRETNEQVDIIDQESKHLQDLKKRIEERKKAFASNKKPDVITLHQPVIQKQDEELKDSEVVHVPLKDLEIEKTITEKSQTETKKQKKESIPTTEFKVLGVGDFEKKAKVTYL